LDYRIKEVFYSLQGERYHSGRSAVFCRFSGCNLWSGKESDRHKAICKFCDTDFLGTDGQGGGEYTDAGELANKIAAMWPDGENIGSPFVVCTGGEPLLQMDEKLIEALHEKKMTIAVETNGTIAAPAGIDWICVSPKAGISLAQCHGHELKLVYPQPGAEPEKYDHLDFDYFFLQPMDGNNRNENTQKAIDYVLHHPQWRISLQLQKIMHVI